METDEEFDFARLIALVRQTDGDVMLGHVPFTAERATTFVSALRERETACCVGLHHCSISASILGEITTGLENKYVSLDVSDNPIGDAGAVVLASFIGKSTTITHLYLANCGVGEAGTLAIAEAIAASPTLEVVHISGDEITPRGDDAIVSAILKSTTLMSITVSYSRRPVPGPEENALIVTARARFVRFSSALALSVRHRVFVPHMLALAGGGRGDGDTPISRFLRRDGDNAILHRVAKFLVVT
jgi:hypothetical protein